MDSLLKVKSWKLHMKVDLKFIFLCMFTKFTKFVILNLRLVSSSRSYIIKWPSHSSPPPPPPSSHELRPCNIAKCTRTSIKRYRDVYTLQSKSRKQRFWINCFWKKRNQKLSWKLKYQVIKIECNHSYISFIRSIVFILYFRRVLVNADPSEVQTDQIRYIII